MALDVAATSFVWNSADTVGTNYDLVLGFQPKFVFLWATGAPGSTDTVGRGHIELAFGAGTSNANRWGTTFRSGDLSAQSNIGVYHSTGFVLASINGASPPLPDGELDIAAQASWPANGIRLVVTDNLGAGSLSFSTLTVGVLAVGGSDITAQNCFSVQEAGATGNTSYAHGLGTTPSGAIFVSVGFLTAPPAGIATQGSYSVGAFDGTNSWVLYGGGDDLNSTMATVSYALTGELVALGPDPASIINGRASGVSADATNLTLNWTERTSTRYVFVLAWAGGQFTVGSTTTATNTTPFNGPAAGFTPSLALVGSACRAASTVDTTSAHMQLSLGAATSASARIALSLLDTNGVATSETTTALETDAVYANISTASAIQGLMDIADMTVDPMQFVMDDADPVASFVGVAMWGSLAPTPGVLVPPSTNRITRQSGRRRHPAVSSPGGFF